MTIYEQDAKTLELPWPFTGREAELELVRRSSAAGRPGVVVTGPVGCGKTRLITEAVRGTDCARITGTPESRGLPFAAFAHLLPGTVSLHRAVQLLSGVRLLVVDDAHLLDEASAALVHQLAAHGSTRLVVAVTDGVPVPGAVSRLWTGELLPRVALEPLPREDTGRLLATAGLEPLTVGRLHRMCRGDLRLLRDLVAALRRSGGLTRVPECDEWAWRGPVPVTATVRDRLAPVLDRAGAGERETLDRLAFAEPLPLALDDLDLDVLERLEADGLIHVDDLGSVTLAHPLHGPALRATAGRLRSLRLTGAPDRCGPALAAERTALERGLARQDVRGVPTPVGDWLLSEGLPVPGGYAVVRARYSRLRGELREAAAWAREGLRAVPGDARCADELDLVTACLGGSTGGYGRAVAARGDIEGALAALPGDDVFACYDAVRLGRPELAAGRLPAGGVFARHAEALARGDGPALDLAAGALAERGFLLFAAEAHAQAVRAHRDPRAARLSRTRAVALARRCQGARTPALAGLVLGELTARQRQIVALAAAGLSNREIAGKLTLSVRTVGNHLYSAYTRLGASDRGALPWLTDLREAEPA
ncbi:helix-turn-helix transcriptional regulator [Streptomyces collinus]|uniref:Regulatory protein n=1 Tax=Streptomyces collinus (strain DSM 40733 / Tue 365) TaxID=1214242 RepID=S5VR12_STRC3|nr:LuxR C-terminal-related transcriptional regulator [Streptomyces collinus]AGS73052.1 regulatory protein [Streptomyces collinus Tu 365]UJA11716.1 regulatory protein [Streptomyces collinus]UJA13418.1 regulatory protein [Streptomyces collinus]